MNKRTASRLWGQLKQHLINAERVLQEIIEQRAWEPLGYDSFAEAWDAQNMSDITLATELRPHVIYQLLAEGGTVESIAATVKGVGPEQVKAAKRQRQHGVPASKAVLVRQHGRTPPCPPSVIRTEVGVDKMREYRKIAQDFDTTVEAIAAEAIAERFAMLHALESRRA